MKDYDPMGKTIAIIGTGASAVQAVPNLSTQGVEKLLVFQRTPCWSPPRYDFYYSQMIKKIFFFLPFLQTLYRYFYFWRNELRFLILFCKSNTITKRLSDWIHGLVKLWYNAKLQGDKDLMQKLVPSYNMGCKRITPSDEYIATFKKPFVHLITEKIEMITKEGIKTAEEEHKADTIVYATGFDMQATARPFHIEGLDGKCLADEYDDAPRAYNGITHPEAPNAFVLLGPGTGLGHNTIIFMIECQVKISKN